MGDLENWANVCDFTVGPPWMQYKHFCLVPESQVMTSPPVSYGSASRALTHTSTNHTISEQWTWKGKKKQNDVLRRSCVKSQRETRPGHVKERWEQTASRVSEEPEADKGVKLDEQSIKEKSHQKKTLHSIVSIPWKRSYICLHPWRWMELICHSMDKCF